MIDEHLSIREARNELKKVENELDLYLEKKQINFEKTQPGATDYKNVIAKTNIIFDKFTHYLIKDEENDSKIYYLAKLKNSYEKYILEEQKRISENGGSEFIVFLRDDQKLPWNDISDISHYSLRQCHRLYDEAKKSKKMAQNGTK